MDIDDVDVWPLMLREGCGLSRGTSPEPGAHASLPTAPSATNNHVATASIRRVRGQNELDYW